MHVFTFYCKITHNGVTNSNPGIYSFTSKNGHFPGKFLLISNSTKVWRQGSKGRVKIFKDRNYGRRGYITNNEEAMKEFFWIKLQAQPV